MEFGDSLISVIELTEWVPRDDDRAGAAPKDAVLRVERFEGAAMAAEGIAKRLADGRAWAGVVTISNSRK